MKRRGGIPGGLDARGAGGQDNGGVSGKDSHALLSNLRADIEGDGLMGSPGSSFVANVEQTNGVAVGHKPGKCCTGWWKVKVAEEGRTGVGCAVADCVGGTMDEDDGGRRHQRAPPDLGGGHPV